MSLCVLIADALHSGGAVPGSLFTVECWNAVKKVLAPDGVLALVRSTAELAMKSDDRLQPELCWSTLFASRSCCSRHVDRIISYM